MSGNPTESQQNGEVQKNFENRNGEDLYMLNARIANLENWASGFQRGCQSLYKKTMQCGMLSENVQAEHFNQSSNMKVISGQLQQLFLQYEKMRHQNNEKDDTLKSLADHIGSQNRKINALLNKINVLQGQIDFLMSFNNQAKPKSRQPKKVYYFDAKQDEPGVGVGNVESRVDSRREFYVDKEEVKPNHQYDLSKTFFQPKKNENHNHESFLEMKNSLSRPFSSFVTDGNMKVEKYGAYIVTSDYCKSLTQVTNAIVENRYGKIIFYEPLNFQNKKVQECVLIEPDNIQILDPEWEVTCQAVLYNYKNFGNLREEYRKQMRNEIGNEFKSKKNVKSMKIDQSNGDVHLQMIYH